MSSTPNCRKAIFSVLLSPLESPPGWHGRSKSLAAIYLRGMSAGTEKQPHRAE